MPRSWDGAAAARFSAIMYHDDLGGNHRPISARRTGPVHGSCDSPAAWRLGTGMDAGVHRAPRSWPCARARRSPMAAAPGRQPVRDRRLPGRAVQPARRGGPARAEPRARDRVRDRRPGDRRRRPDRLPCEPRRARAVVLLAAPLAAVPGRPVAAPHGFARALWRHRSGFPLLGPARGRLAWASRAVLRGAGDAKGLKAWGRRQSMTAPDHRRPGSSPPDPVLAVMSCFDRRPGVSVVIAVVYRHSGSSLDCMPVRRHVAWRAYSAPPLPPSAAAERGFCARCGSTPDDHADEAVPCRIGFFQVCARQPRSARGSSGPTITSGPSASCRGSVVDDLPRHRLSATPCRPARWRECKRLHGREQVGAAVPRSPGLPDDAIAAISR